MFSAFLNPFTIIAGSALVLTPIIIHLINRIRFRRVKWAAMEFLLKAQKKMRRKKILEQLLLLFLRCLLVFLAGVLFARFIGCDLTSGKETRPTTHLVILDDTPSTADGWRREDGQQTDAFSEGKRLVYERLMPAAAEAQTNQSFHVLRLSDLDRPFPSGTTTIKQDGADKEIERKIEDVRAAARVTTDSIAAMEAHLKPLRPGVVRRSLVEGLRKAKELLDKRAEGNTAQVIHVVSDLRAADWTADGPAISELIKEFKDNGVAVHLVDVANPARKPDRKSPPFSDNVSIVEVKPRSRVVSVNQQTEIEVRVKNNGATDLKDVRLDFYLNGQPDVDIRTINIPSLPANQERTQSVQGTFKQAGTKDRPLDRFNIVTAALATPEPGGLAVDNVRHTVVEVRDALKVLVVDGRTLEGGTDLRTRPEGDSYFLRALLLDPKPETRLQLGKLDVVNADAAQVEKIDLRPFSTVYLMNVPTLSPAAVEKLEKFVREGGGVGVFLGPNVKPEEYNARMYRGGGGFFPVPLAPEYSKELSPDQKAIRTLSFNARLMLRDPANRMHPALKGIYTDESGQPVKEAIVERYFRLPIIDHHWPVGDRRWKEDKSVRELYCLQNETPIGEFEGRANALVAEVKKLYNEPKFEKARKYLDPLLEKIKTLPAETKPLSDLARLMDELLCDQINYGDESEPVLREFWEAKEMAETKRAAAQLRDQVKYGDPLYVVKEYGQGRVAVMTTDAGGTFTGKKIWTDWPSLSGAAGWVPVVAEMQKYLSGGGDDINRAVGDRFFAEFDLNRYEPTVGVNFLTTSEPGKPGGDRKLALLPEALGKITMDAPADAKPDAPARPYQLSYTNAKKPGIYMFTLTRKPDNAGPAPAPVPGGPEVVPDPLGGYDFVGAAFNVDALAEGDLRRANTDDIAAQTFKAPLHNTEDLGWIDDLKQKPADLSSGRWLYLLVLLVLVAEQAWAVRISYHTKPEDLEALAPSAAAAYAHHTAVPSDPAGEPAGTGAPTG